jgi:hypothetical protein
MLFLHQLVFLCQSRCFLRVLKLHLIMTGFVSIRTFAVRLLYAKKTYVFEKKRGFLSNGHSPQICQNGKLLVRMCRGESHFSQNVECERMYRVRGNGWRMSGECIESGENGWRMLGECIESGHFSKMAILASTRIRQIRQRVAIA